MANLRDKGYPQSRTERANQGDKRNAVMTNNTPVMTFRGSQYMGDNTVPSQTQTAIDKLITAYNNRAFGIPNAPMLSNSAFDYVDDNTDSRALDSTIALRNHAGSRLGFAGKNTIDGGNTRYSVGVDNLPFGENTYNGSLNLPFGTLDAEYDGDGTAVLGFESNPNNYYIRALASLLRR